MFVDITINLDSPLCNCDEQKLKWNTSADDKARLILWCETCKTELRIPREKFVAHFKLAKPYPGKKKPEAPKTKLGVLDGGKAKFETTIIPFGDPSAVDPTDT